MAESNMVRGWHDVYVRFGQNTIKTFGALSDPGIVLGTDDIFLIDIGPVFEQWEGDGGDTFIVGQNLEMQRCANDAREIFQLARREWLDEKTTGKDLYAFAKNAAEKRGWILNMDLSGHRISDFPHAAIHEGSLAEIDFHPANLLWVLEIHIRHPTKPYGAFFEDMLLENDHFNLI